MSITGIQLFSYAGVGLPPGVQDDLAIELPKNYKVILPTLPDLPFPLPVNTNILFEKQSEGTTVDPTTGNEVQNKENIVVYASLRDRFEHKREGAAGLPEKIFSLTGYILSSSADIQGLDFTQTVEANLLNFANQASVSGQMSIEIRPTPYSMDVLQQAGIRIDARLTLAGTGETSDKEIF